MGWFEVMHILEDVCSAVLWLIAIALLLSGSWVAALFSGVWLVVGMLLVQKTASRGFLADASFVVTWPFYVVTGR